MNYSARLFDFVKGWESFKPVASVDPLKPSISDIGFGHVLKPGESFGHIAYQRAEQILHDDLDQVAAGVSMLVKVPLQQQQFDALCSFAINLGLDIDADDVAEGLGDSTLLKFVNAGLFDKAALQFLLWHNASHKAEWGLAKRRFAEVVMFSFADYSWRP